jgi:hypothetical protein
MMFPDHSYAVDVRLQVDEGAAAFDAHLVSKIAPRDHVSPAGQTPSIMGGASARGDL